MASLHAAAATPSETVTAFHAAITAGERDKALAMLSPEVVIYESGHVERSRDEYAKGHLGSDIAFGREMTRKVLKRSERVSGNMALVFDETETSGTWKGKPVKSMGVETAVLEKQGDGWIITHVHWSSRKGH
ncbi:nuclear transport factor 2 family protein [Massilia sp. PAMC28688]|nr:nuclear transport factor 2 family protein [Massilia sp. PAMC28688]